MVPVSAVLGHGKIFPGIFKVANFPPGSYDAYLLIHFPFLSAGGRSLHLLKKARHNWRWRPAQPVAADPRHWWRFAIHCVLDVVHRTRYFFAGRVKYVAKAESEYIQQAMHNRYQ
jgi:hypothetical protein